jgi:hypothetical protein
MNYELEAYVGELKFLRDFYRKNTVKTEQKPDYPRLGEARYKEDGKKVTLENEWGGYS